MATGITIKVEGELVRQGLEDVAAEIPKIGRRRLRTTLNRMERRLRKPGLRPTYPIHWDSERQRRAYFATDGFGGGIPSQRSGRYENGWDIEGVKDGYRLYNKSAYAQYVGGNAFGTRQSRIHMGRWQLYRDVVEDEIDKLPPEVEKEISLVARRKGL